MAVIWKVMEQWKEHLFGVRVHLFLGLFSSDFAQGGIQIQDSILLGAVWLAWSRLVVLRSFPSGF